MSSSNPNVVAIEERKKELKKRIKNDWHMFSIDLISGIILGGVAHTVVAPIERVKLVLQTQYSNVIILRGKRRPYRGMVDAIFRITKEEGFWSLWRGNGISVLRYYPSLALNFAFKDYYRALLSPDRLGPNQTNHIQLGFCNFLAGAVAGSTSLLFTYPLDIAHTRLATDVGSAKQFTGLGNFFKSIYAAQGFRGLYQGFPASVHGIFIHRGIYFGGFDTAKQIWHDKDDTSALSFPARWFLAQLSTTAAGIISYPFDTVRHRMMMQAGQEEAMYCSTMDCWHKIYVREGIAAFYKGCMSNMVRGVGAAMILVLYDEVKKWTHKAFG